MDSVGTEELLYADNLDKAPRSWSADTKLLLYDATGGPNRGRDLWVLPLTPERPSVALKPSLVLQTPFNEGLAQFSSDGRWILYTSDESQRQEVYAAPFVPLSRGLSRKRQISVAGMIGINGGTPRWRQDGREIFYVSPDRRVMATEIAINGDRLDVGMTRPLFEVLSALRQAFDVSADGRRFLLLATPEEKSTLPITLVQNWAAGLKN